MRNAVSLIVLSLIVADTAAQAPDDFTKNYIKNEENLYARYAINKKVVWNHYGTGNNVMWSAVSITGKDSAHITYDYQNEGTVAHIRVPDNIHILSDIHSKPKIKSQDGERLFEYGFPYTAFSTMSPQLWPMKFFELSVGNTIGNNIRISQLKPPGYRPFRIESVTESEFRGRKALAIVGVSNMGPMGTIFVDREKWICLGFIDKKEGYEGYVTYDYKPGEDYPLPKQFEIWKVDAAGKKTLSSKDVIVEYSDYTPSPDEFDIEKRYGLKPLPPKVKLRPDAPALKKPGRTWGYWLYGGGICLALFSVGIVIYLRMKK